MTIGVRIAVYFAFSCVLGACDSSSQSGQSPTPPAPPPTSATWNVPNCNEVSGSNRVSFTNDDGNSYAARSGDVASSPPPLARSITPISNVPNFIVAVTESHVLSSENSGCNWSVITSTADPTLTVLDSGSDHAIFWSLDTGAIYRYSLNSEFEELGIASSSGLRGIGIAPDDELHLRAVSRSGQVLESVDGGRLWSSIGDVPNNQIVSIINSAEFGKQDINHIIVSKAREVWTSFDGGRNWIEASGFDDNWDAANITKSRISPVNDLLVWSFALDLTVLPDLTSTNRKGFYVSTDGGVTFALEIDASPSEALSLDQVAIFEPGTIDQNKLFGVHTNEAIPTCTVELYIYDLSTKQLTIRVSSDIASVGSLTQSPASADYIYVGVERRASCNNG